MDIVAEICAALNKFMRTKVEDDIRKAFEQADKEAREIKKRVNEGLAVAKAKGQVLGRQVTSFTARLVTKSWKAPPSIARNSAEC